MTNTDRIHLTEQGLNDLREELHRLRTVERPLISERIKEAKEGGDISESGEYEDAKQRQAFLEGRIRELEILLARAEVIDPSSQQAGVVTLGSKVTVEEDGLTDTYMVVNRAEAGRDKSGGMRISTESPFGAALVGRRVGDEVKVSTPSGQITLKILAVE